MKETDIKRLLTGAAWLDYMGDVYEYIGSDGRGHYTFQSINDDSYISAAVSDLMASERYALAEIEEDF